MGDNPPEPTVRVPTPDPREPPETFQLVARSLTYESPLPPAEVFQAYERAVPGTGLRLLKLVEQEQAESFAFKRRGQVFGFITTLVGMSCATWLMSAGHNVYGFVFVLVALTPLVSGFLGRALRAVEARMLSALVGRHGHGPD